ncbi:SRPBCC family protein [Ardenticatena maritima]|uniref:SRPBCC family protein n=2 Tax=Ardenticatena maritima TaxID=872965 RepID=UPI000761B5CF|nr:SRPBCC family protein [Ardenticatena maritima]
MTHRFEHTFIVHAPLEQVAAFHYAPDAFRRLTPPLLPVQVHHAEPLADGSTTEFTLWLGPLPVRWVARHRHVGPRGFTDEQVRGPFRQWIHRHTFEPIDAHTTRVRDTIEAAFHSHPFWALVGRLIWWGQPLLFQYRAWATQQALAANPLPARTIFATLFGVSLLSAAILSILLRKVRS